MLEQVKTVKESSKILEYLSKKFIFSFIEMYPEIIFDGNFVTLPYVNLDDDLKEDRLKTYIGYFNDLKWILYVMNDLGTKSLQQEKFRLLRCSYSVKILLNSISTN